MHSRPGCGQFARGAVLAAFGPLGHKCNRIEGRVETRPVCRGVSHHLLAEIGIVRQPAVATTPTCFPHHQRLIRQQLFNHLRVLAGQHRHVRPEAGHPTEEIRYLPPATARLTRLQRRLLPCDTPLGFQVVPEQLSHVHKLQPLDLCHQLRRHWGQAVAEHEGLLERGGTAFLLVAGSEDGVVAPVAGLGTCTLSPDCRVGGSAPGVEPARRIPRSRMASGAGITPSSSPVRGGDGNMIQSPL